MTVFIFWLLLSVAVGIYANNKGRNGFGWFLFALIASPLVAFVFALAVKNLNEHPDKSGAQPPGPATHVKCPACAEWVLPEASVCKHCGNALTPDPQFSKKVAESKRQADKEESKNLAIGVAFIFGLFMIAAVISMF